jgi:hypothetical protein
VVDGRSGAAGWNEKTGASGGRHTRLRRVGEAAAGATPGAVAAPTAGKKDCPAASVIPAGSLDAASRAHVRRLASPPAGLDPYR